MRYVKEEENMNVLGERNTIVDEGSEGTIDDEPYDLRKSSESVTVKWSFA